MQQFVSDAVRSGEFTNVRNSTLETDPALRCTITTARWPRSILESHNPKLLFLLDVTGGNNAQTDRSSKIETLFISNPGYQNTFPAEHTLLGHTARIQCQILPLKIVQNTLTQKQRYLAASKVNSSHTKANEQTDIFLYR